MSYFYKALDFVEVAEGGYSDDPNDTGNWTGGAKGKGELRGTQYGISAAAYPTLDIKALTKDEARAIYKRDYWDRIDGDDLPWPLSLVAFDHAVNAGVGRARKTLDETTDPHVYIAQRLEDYTTYRTWQHHGRGWTRRMAALLREVAAQTPESTPVSASDGRRGSLSTIVLHTALGEVVVRLPVPVVANYRGDKLDVDTGDMVIS